MRRVFQLLGRSKKKRQKTNSQQCISHGNKNIWFLFWVLFFSPDFCRKTYISRNISLRTSVGSLVCLALTLFETRNYSTLEYFVLLITFKNFVHKISLLNSKRHNSIEQTEKTRGALKQKCF